MRPRSRATRMGGSRHISPRWRRLASTLKMLPEELAGTKPGAPAPALRPDQQALLKDYEALSPGYRRAARRLLRDLGRVRT
jgi:hypothetical protein